MFDTMYTEPDNGWLRMAEMCGSVKYNKDAMLDSIHL